VVSRQKADIADTLHLRNVVMATSFWIYMGTHLRHLVNRTEPSICGGDAALCQITLTTCFFNRVQRTFSSSGGGSGSDEDSSASRPPPLPPPSKSSTGGLRAASTSRAPPPTPPNQRYRHPILRANQPSLPQHSSIHHLIVLLTSSVLHRRRHQQQHRGRSDLHAFCVEWDVKL